MTVATPPQVPVLCRARHARFTLSKLDLQCMSIHTVCCDLVSCRDGAVRSMYATCCCDNLRGHQTHTATTPINTCKQLVSKHGSELPTRNSPLSLLTVLPVTRRAAKNLLSRTENVTATFPATSLLRSAEHPRSLQ